MIAGFASAFFKKKKRRLGVNNTVTVLFIAAIGALISG